MTIENDNPIRNKKEQDKYIKSLEYQSLLNDLEELRIKRENRKINKKEYMKDYNHTRCRTENKIRELSFIKGDVTTKFNPIKLNRIPTIKMDGTIIWSDTNENQK
jgi:hypothetical protein